MFFANVDGRLKIAVSIFLDCLFGFIGGLVGGFLVVPRPAGQHYEIHSIRRGMKYSIQAVIAVGRAAMADTILIPGNLLPRSEEHNV
jgi:hypothetical protein